MKFLVPFVAFAGFLVGDLLARISPEEMGPGERYFTWVLRVILLAVIVSLFYFSGFSWFGLLLGVIFGFFVREYYFAFGISLAMATLVSGNALLLLGALVFAAGIVYGTLTSVSGRFTFTNVFAKVAFFFLPFCILFVGVPPVQFMNFAAGSILVILFIKNLPKGYKLASFLKFR